MSTTQTRVHLVGESIYVGVPACRNSSASGVFAPLHDFLLDACDGVSVCKTCFRTSKQYADNPAHESHLDFEALVSLPEAVPNDLVGKTLSQIWYVANDRWFGFTVKPGKGYSIEHGLGSLGYVPNQRYERAVYEVEGGGICAVCGGRLDPGTAIKHDSPGYPEACEPTDPGAVHWDCFDRPIPNTHITEEIKL